MGNTSESTGSESERTWDIYVIQEGLADEACATSLAPWMRVRLPETDNLEYWKPVEDKVASSLPMKKLSLDLLTSIGEDLPIWIDLRSLEGEPLPRGLSPAIGVRSGDIANFAKMALVYETGPGEEVDLREHVPNQIIVLPRSQAPKLTLEALRKKLPGRRFELLRQGQYDCLCPKWEELSEKTKQALPADMLRIKAVSDKVSKSATFLQGDDEAKARPARRRHLQRGLEGLYQPLLLSH